MAERYSFGYAARKCLRYVGLIMETIEIDTRNHTSLLNAALVSNDIGPAVFTMANKYLDEVAIAMVQSAWLAAK